jgi:hypothetical protein
MKAAREPVSDHLPHDHDPTDVFRSIPRPSVLAHPRPVLAHPRLIPRTRVARGTRPPPAERRRMVTPADLEFDDESTTMPSASYVRPTRAPTG